MTQVGFIGLGSQGGPMARRIVDSGFDLTIWARRPESVAPFRETPARVAATPAEVGEASEIVGLCVVADADVEDVMLRPDGVLAGMRPGGVVAIHSTVHPDTCRRLADQARAREIAIVDAPVSGGGAVAAERRLLVMVGGDDEPVARCRPVFETFGDPVIHLGPIGSGQLTKLVNNFVYTAQLAAALDTFSFAERLGIDRAALAGVLERGSGGSYAVSSLAHMEFDLTLLHEVGAPLLRKDVDLMHGIARDTGVPEPPAFVELAERALALLAASGRARQ